MFSQILFKKALISGTQFRNLINLKRCSSKHVTFETGLLITAYLDSSCCNKVRHEEDQDQFLESSWLDNPCGIGVSSLVHRLPWEEEDDKVLSTGYSSSEQLSYNSFLLQLMVTLSRISNWIEDFVSYFFYYIISIFKKYIKFGCIL